jgi:hypothetical protein
MVGVTSLPILTLRGLHDEARLGLLANGAARQDFSLNFYPCFPWPTLSIFLPNIRDLEAQNQGGPDLPGASFQA